MRDDNLRTTRFSDVCGSLDELKRMLREEPSPDPEAMAGLLEDVRYMLGRMERRLKEYRAFEQEAERQLELIRGVGRSRREEALAVASQMGEALAAGPDAAGVDALCAQAEHVREVASELERKLYAARDASIALYRLCVRLKGGRPWEPAAPAETDMAGRLEPWLPPSPHRERILDFLQRGRAHLLPAGEEGLPPAVEFEDGGVMPLPEVRWSEPLGNFHPAGADPHPGGLKYRGG